MKRILVTGHTGFIGSALCGRLTKGHGFETIGLSSSCGKDLRDPGALEQLEMIDYVVHLAARVGVPEGWENPREIYHDNIVMTLNILDFAKTRQIPVLLLSSYVYGPPEYQPIDESHPIKSSNPYALSKRITDELGEAYARDFNVPVTILRPFNLYGPRQAGTAVIQQLVAQAVDIGKLSVYDLNPKRDYLYVEDLVDGLVRILENTPPEAGTFNIGTGESYSVREVIDLLFQVLGEELEVEITGNKRKNEIQDCRCDPSKFSRRFSWTPSHSLVQGLSKTLRAYKR